MKISAKETKIMSRLIVPLQNSKNSPTYSISEMGSSNKYHKATDNLSLEKANKVKNQLLLKNYANYVTKEIAMPLLFLVGM
jgi:hypothetical protein